MLIKTRFGYHLATINPPCRLFVGQDGVAMAETHAGDFFRHIGQKEARSLGLKTYFIGSLCPNGEQKDRLTSSARCTCEKCKADAARATAAYEASRKDKIREKRADFRAKNREKIRASQAIYYRTKNKGASQSARRAAALKATPPWVSQSDLVAVFLEAARLTAETRVEHHVDHIVPLQSRHVCGLHVPWNLRAIPASENLSKRNRLRQGDGVTYFEECL